MKNKISLFEFSSMLFSVTLAPFLGIGIYNILKISKNDSFISILIGYILSIILIFIYKKISDYMPELNIKEKIIRLFNKRNAFIVIVILSICFFLISCILSYNINSFIISQFLSETPILFVTVILFILVIYINKKGFNTIARVSLILAILSIILIFIASIGKYQQFNITNLKPILNFGIKNPIIGGIMCFLMTTIHSFLLLIVPKNNILNNNKIYKYIFITITFAYLIFMIITIYTISVLGIDLALLYHYPAYITMKEISIVTFIDKIENFIIIHWIFEIFISLSINIYFIFKMTNIKPIIIISLNIILDILLFKNSTSFNFLVTKYLPIISIIIIFIMVILFLKIKKRVKTL